MTGYAVIIESADDGGFGAWAPDLPGCVATASTYDECLMLMREAVAFHLEGMRDNGEPIPPPTTVGVETVVAA